MCTAVVAASCVCVCTLLYNRGPPGFKINGLSPGDTLLRPSRNASCAANRSVGTIVRATRRERRKHFKLLQIYLIPYAAHVHVTGAKTLRKYIVHLPVLRI